MQLASDLHLAYCTNIHRGESWPETLAALEQQVLRVRHLVCPADVPFAIGLRLSARAAATLAQPAELDAFRRWLDRHRCYVFSLNGFPYGDFHGTRVKEQVYRPDWSEPARLAYTQQLFALLARLLPAGVAGSVSTVPLSFKAFGEPRHRLYAHHLGALALYLDDLADRSGHDLHLGLEPEPLCTLETSAEAVAWFAELHERLPAAAPAAARRRLGLNYDTCHLAVEYEAPAAALGRLHAAGIRLSKLHLSSALRLPEPARHAAVLAPFVEPTYLHQVVAARAGAIVQRWPDLDQALAAAASGADVGDEWRVHFHVPLHAAPAPPLLDTRDHLEGALAWLAAHPGACAHLEMETYTWGVLPPELKCEDVADQLAREYAWTLAALRRHRLAPPEG